MFGKHIASHKGFQHKHNPTSRKSTPTHLTNNRRVQLRRARRQGLTIQEYISIYCKETK